MKKLKLQKLRLQHKITQAEMASLLNVTQATYSRKERGLTDITLEEWDRIATILDTDKKEIFEDASKKTPITTKKQYLVIPAALLEQIENLTKENLELKEKLKRYESQNK